MRNIRFPIAAMMAVVVVIALGLAALRNASALWAGSTFLLACAVLCLAVVGVVCRRDTERAWWLGFGLFGWGYMFLAFYTSIDLPTMAVMNAVGSQLGSNVQFPGTMNDGGMGGGGLSGFAGMMSAPLQVSGAVGGSVQPAGYSLEQIAHCLWALLAALLGGALSIVLFGARKKPAQNPDDSAPLSGRVLRHARLFRGGILVLSACVVAMSFLALLSRSAPDFWAGATFLATCALLGLTILGAAGEHGSRRQAWLGAALMGAGYMTLAFGRHPDADTPVPQLPTEQLLHAVRGWMPASTGNVPSSWSGTGAANYRVWYALEQPVPMHFPNDTALEDVLNHVRASTRGPDGKSIPIYVDPIGISEADKTMSSAVTFDLDGVPLKTTLRLCLAQLDLAYSIRNGMLFITSAESAPPASYQDPFLIAGHCLLALLVAALGALLAPLVPHARREASVAQVVPVP